MISFPLDKYPEMVFQDCIVVVFLIFLEETLIFLEDTGASVHGFPDGSDGKASAYNAGDTGLIPGSGRSSGEGNGNPLQYSCLENPMDGGAW